MSDPAGSLALYERKRNADGSRALERAQQGLLVGNLYLNRALSGAIVERHPVGGFKMPGGGTMAGGKEYQQNFLFPRAVVENVMRRGFTPPEES